MLGLRLWNAAAHSLRVLNSTDEVKEIRDKHQAIAAYARQAKDTELMDHAKSIQLRAERRLGELLAAMEKNKGAAERGGPSPPRLDEMGISKDHSSDFQAVAAIPEGEFEAEIASNKATTKSLAKKGRKVQDENALAVVKAKGTPITQALVDEMTITAKEGARVAAKPKKEQSAAAAKAAKRAKKPPKPKIETVPKAEYDKLVVEYNELRDNRDDLASELEACVLLREDKLVVRFKQLEIEMRTVERSRNDAMNLTAQMQKQINWLLRELKKRGWEDDIPKKAIHA